LKSKFFTIFLLINFYLKKQPIKRWKCSQIYDIYSKIHPTFIVLIFEEELPFDPEFDDNLELKQQAAKTSNTFLIHLQTNPKQEENWLKIEEQDDESEEEDDG